MKKIICVSFIMLTSFVNSFASTWYVDVSAVGSNNGMSWANAFTDLQSGIAASIVGDQIWVAQGVYKPTTTTNRSTSFTLPDGVKIYGGFNGTETLLTERNIILNTTILSGDIGTTGSASDNSYHVVYAHNVGTQTRLDGFTIVGANSLGSGISQSGAGLISISASPTIANCTFTANHAASAGGAISHQSSGVIKILNCDIENNNCSSDGGGIHITAGTALILDCNISNNQSSSDAGGILIYDGFVTIDRCIISGNSSSSLGGGLVLYDGTLYMSNTLIVGNSSDAYSGIDVDGINLNSNYISNCIIADNFCGNTASSNASVKLTQGTSFSNSIIWGNQTAAQVWNLLNAPVSNCIIQGGLSGSTALNILTSNPQFISPGNAFAAPFDATAYDYHSSDSSPIIDAGNNSLINPGITVDLDSMPRIHGGTVDIGTYENNYCLASFNISPSGSTTFCPGGSVTLSAGIGNGFLWSTSATTSSITVNAAGNYSVHKVDSVGCLGADTVTVSLFSASANITGTNHFCTGGSTILTASGTNASGYNWSSSETTSAITVSAGGTYSVTVTSTDGCTSTHTTTVTVNSNPNPSINYSGGNLTTGNFTSYQWYLNGNPVGTNSNSYTPSQNGTYTVTVTNSNGCTGTSSSYVLSNVGMSEVEFENQFSIFPNPVTSEFSVEGISPNSLIQIADVTGKILLTETISEKKTVNISAFASGIYFLKTEKGTKRIVKM